MTSKDALKAAKAIAEDRATVTLHRGDTRKDRAIRISGCWPDEAASVGREIEIAIDGALRVHAGFVAVWF